MKLIIIKIPEVLHSRAINGKLTDLDTMFICGAVAQGKPLQTELEKIKAEIIACTQQEEGEVPACINYGIKLSTEIVEKHISELKGE